MEPAQRPHSEPGFLEDLGAAIRAWGYAPMLPILSLLIWAVPSFLPRVAGGLVGLLLLSAIGWVGTERVWYLRLFRETGLYPRELVTLTVAFFGRYFVLGLILVGVLLPVAVVVALTDSPSILAAVALALWLPIDLSLTFVTPALAFSTRQVSQALAIGLRMIPREWPRSAWYVLVPPLAALATSRAFSNAEGGTLLAGMVTVVAALLNLAFKGATAAFYLRRFTVGDDGAAFLPREAASDGLSGPAWRGPESAR